jgi:DNA-binding GntR family transcriptional regulator
VTTTLKEKAYEVLKDMICNGQLKSGEFITERAMVEQLQMSRTPIRAALERLEVEGLVNYSPNRGLSVAELSISGVRDVYDLREALECHVIKRLCATNLTRAQIDQVADNLEGQKACIEQQDIERFVKIDADFHTLLSVINGNQEIEQAMRQIHVKLHLLAQRVMSKDPERPKISYQEHMQIVQFIMDKSVEQATALMETHLEIGKQRLIM